MFRRFRRNNSNITDAAWEAVGKSQIVVQFSLSRRIIHCNENFLQLYGLTESEALGMNHEEFCPVEIVNSSAYEAFWRKLRSGEFDRGEYRRVAKDGREVWVRASYNPVLNGAGKVHSILKISSDVTEDVLRHADAEGKMAALNKSLVMLEMEMDGRIIRANDNFLRVSERTQDDVRGKYLRDMCEQNPGGTSREAVRDKLHTGDSANVLLRINNASGSKVLLQSNLSPILDPAGNPQKIVILATDVTDRDELREALERAEVAAKAKSSFLANMSHEVRTPMAGMMGFTDLLLTSELNENQRDQLEMIRDSGDKLLTLLNDILDVSKIEAGKMQLARERVDAGHIVRSCSELMRPVAKRKGIDLIVEVAVDMPQQIYGDGLRLRQIVLNLIGNAVKFTDAGHVRVSLTPDENRETARLCVEDTGIGIAADRIGAVMGKFVQADEGRTDHTHGGSGLGLTISNELARLMGGKLSLTSEEAKGTIVQLDMPLEIVCKNDWFDDSAAEVEQECAERSDAPRVLVAEDNEINQHLALRQLESIGARADIAENGRRAIGMVQEAFRQGDPYRLVLMDIRMPEMGGVETARKLREAGFEAKVLPIIALTANAYRDDIRECLDAGMQAHLAKPTDLAGLKLALECWIPQEGEERSQAEENPPEVRAKAKPDVEAMYARQREELFDLLSSVIDRRACEGAHARDLVNLLHKLAGTAGYFGDGDFGEAARRFETELETASEAERLQIVENAAKVLHATA